MKCPVCGIRHRTLEKARSCISKIKNQWTFWVIAHQASKGSGKTIEENIVDANLSLEHYREDKAKHEEILEYERHFTS